ncbi:MAG: hypothetical protein M0Z75_02360 [Nitrospiraceae bacterium]|nr:hypothetical protein [Nitrospiraceae bacterium]
MKAGAHMPHFGLIDEDALGPVEGPLMRAKLHIRGGRRRFERGKFTDGILAVYDALCSAMQWYIAAPERMRKLRVKKSDDLLNDRNLYAVLVRSRVLDGSFDFEEMNALVARALSEEIRDFDWRGFMGRLVPVFTQLGVMPFDEKILPEEKPEPFLKKPAS